VLELLGDDVIGGQCHGDSSFERSGRWPMSGPHRRYPTVVPRKHSRGSGGLSKAVACAPSRVSG
jgi:hypothetical protein